MIVRLRLCEENVPDGSSFIRPKMVESVSKRKREELPPKYPKRLPEESSKFCSRCGAKQIRKTLVIGPSPESLVAKLEVKQPRVTARPIWRKVCLAWLVSPPNPPEPDQWFEVRVTAVCHPCDESHSEKSYRRQFGRFGRFVNICKASYSAAKNLFITMLKFFPMFKFEQYSTFEMIRPHRE